MKDYSVSQKIKYHSDLSKKGAIDSNGNPLNDFQRGVHFGTAKTISRYAAKLKKNGKNINNKKMDLNTRTYSDEELNKLFNNLGEI